MMKKIVFLIPVVLIFFSETFAQTEKPFQQGYNAEGNLKAIDNLKPYSDGAKGFDNRYEGVKGSPRMYDTLLPAMLKVRNQNYYIQVEADLDLVKNTVIFIHPKTRQMMAVPSDIIDEITFNKISGQELFRTSAGVSFDKELKGIVFFQVLKDQPVPFIKMPVKIFTEADYKNLYSPDRRYDEYETSYRYYIFGPDTKFYQIQLNPRSIAKIYPDKKKIIDDTFRDATGNEEKKVIQVLGRF